VTISYHVIALVPVSLYMLHLLDAALIMLLFLVQTVADKGTITDVKCQGSGSSSWTSMTNTYGAAWETDNAPSYPISLQVTSGSQTVSPNSPPRVVSCSVALSLHAMQWHAAAFLPTLVPSAF